MDNEHARTILEFQITRNITNLFKDFLNTIEDLKEEELFNEKMGKFESVFSEMKCARLRKKILTCGNDSIRELNSLIDKLEINFKK